MAQLLARKQTSTRCHQTHSNAGHSQYPHWAHRTCYLRREICPSLPLSARHNRVPRAPDIRRLRSYLLARRKIGRLRIARQDPRFGQQSRGRCRQVSAGSKLCPQGPMTSSLIVTARLQGPVGISRPGSSSCAPNVAYLALSTCLPIIPNLAQTLCCFRFSLQGSNKVHCVLYDENRQPVSFILRKPDKSSWHAYGFQKPRR